MNFAFPALLIVLCSLPGIIFTYAILTFLTNAAGTRRISWPVQITTGTIIALPLHWIFSKVAILFEGLAQFNFSDALLLISNKEGDEVERILKEVGHHAGSVILYFTISIVVSFLLGKLIGGIAVKLFPHFFKNSIWDKAFECGQNEKVSVEAIIERGQGSYVYKGFLSDRNIDEEDVLRGLWLTSPERRPISGDKTSCQNEKSYTIGKPNTHLYLSMKEVQAFSLNVIKLNKNT